MTQNKSQSKRNLQPRTPGEAAPDSQKPPQAEEQEPNTAETTQAGEAAPETSGPETTGDDAAGSEGGEQESPEAGFTEEQELLIEAEVQRRVKAIRRRDMDKPATTEELPHAKDVDPTKIKRAMLTREGYVVPAVTEAKVR